jgi:hypothetical protein
LAFQEEKIRSSRLRKNKRERRMNLKIKNGLRKDMSRDRDWATSDTVGEKTKKQNGLLHSSEEQ